MAAGNPSTPFSNRVYAIRPSHVTTMASSRACDLIRPFAWDFGVYLCCVSRTYPMQAAKGADTVPNSSKLGL